MDFGAKNNIVRSLQQRGCQVTVYPADTSAEEIIKSNPDGIMLSNGPGDPSDCVSIIREVGKLYETDIPIFAICLGHQLMALARGGKTYKLKYGHRGGNHPVKDLSTGRVYISSQNHGYAVDAFHPGSVCGPGGICQCQRRDQRGTVLCGETDLHRSVPPGGVSGATGFRIPV